MDKPRSLRELRFRSWLGLALVDFELEGMAKAEHWLTAAAEAASEQSPMLAMLSSQRASLLARTGQFGEALSEINRGVDHLDALPTRDQSALLLTQGTIVMQLGQPVEAQRIFARSAEIAMAGGHNKEAFMSRSNQGYAAYLQGDLPTALELLSHAEAMTTEVSGAIVRLDRGRVLIDAGLLREAGAVLREAADLTGEDSHHQVLAEIELELAKVHARLDQLSVAREWVTSAHRRFTERGEPRRAAQASVVLDEIDLLGTGHAESVLARAKQRQHIVANADRYLCAHHYLVAARAAWQSGRASEASASLKEVTSTSVSLRPRALLQVAELKARLARHHHDEAAARRVLAQAPHVILREQIGSASTDLRTAISSSAASAAALHLELSLGRGPQELFNTTERWRALTHRLKPVQPPPDAERDGLLTQVREVRIRLAEDPSLSVQERDALQIRERQLRLRIREHSWALGSDAVQPAARIDYRSTRQTLVEQETDLVSFFVAGGVVHAVTVRSGRGRVTQLAPEATVRESARRATSDLDALGRHDLGAFAGAVTSSLQAEMQQLQELLMRPLGLGSRRLLIVPNGQTIGLPWAMMPVLAGVPITVSASATEWTTRTRALGERPAAAPGATAGQDRGNRDVDRRIVAIAGPGLNAADEEVRDVCGVWSEADCIPAEHGTAARLRTALAEADLVHVAAHGSHLEQNPMFASVRMSDGPLFVYDVESSGVGADLVVLSACEVGRSTMRGGLEPVGLASGLLGLGATSVVAGLCRIPDAAARETMGLLHRELFAGRRSDEALAAAIAAGPPVAGAFVLSGTATAFRPSRP
ncbi:CHAT domain-containing protein [soil metagenome]